MVENGGPVLHLRTLLSIQARSAETELPSATSVVLQPPNASKHRNGDLEALASASEDTAVTPTSHIDCHTASSTTHGAAL